MRWYAPNDTGFNARTIPVSSRVNGNPLALGVLGPVNHIAGLAVMAGSTNWTFEVTFLDNDGVTILRSNLSILGGQGVGTFNFEFSTFQSTWEATAIGGASGTYSRVLLGWPFVRFQVNNVDGVNAGTFTLRIGVSFYGREGE